MLFGILLILLFPIAQKKYTLFNNTVLSGDVKLANNIQFTKDDWFQGTYSEQKEKYINDNFGFRNFFIRFISQTYFTLFKTVFAKDVVLGKDGYLYELKYLHTHAGLDYIGDAAIKLRFEKLKFIQTELEKKGVHFALLFAPGKATYYPEFIPAPYNSTSVTTNYIKHIEEAKRTGVNFLDFSELFVRLKPTTKYPLYPKTGTHWSVYGMHVAFDSLSKYIEKVSNKKLPQFNYNTIEMSDSLRTPDGDIAEGLNLLFGLPHFKMAYPVVKWKDDSTAYKPRVLTVSDSYWMGVYYNDLPRHVFSNHEFWYYNKQLFNYNAENIPGNTADADLKTAVEKNNFVFIMATEASLKQMGWGFIDEVYDMYKNGADAYEKSKTLRKKKAEITQLKITIQNDAKWFSYVIRQAKQNNISIDSCLQLNADYNYNENHKNDVGIAPLVVETFEQKVLGFKKAITTNPDWLDKVSKKAKQLGISIDSSITRDAIWMAEQEMKKANVHVPTKEEIQYSEKVNGYKNAIKADPNWLKNVSAKAKEKGISVDSSVMLNAKWMVDQELKKK